MFLNLVQISTEVIGKIKRIYFLCKKEGVWPFAKRIIPAQIRGIQSSIMYKSYGNFGIQGDMMMRNLIQLMSEERQITSIVETGTYRGFTCVLLAEMFPNLPIYSCEILMKNYLEAKVNTKKNHNIKIFNLSSPEFLKKIISEDLVGEMPLIFLDAHWLNYWPLEDELKIISSKLESAIIIIDDFKVPGDSRFQYDCQNGNECSVEMVRPNLNKRNRYTLLLPKYHLKDAYREYAPHHPWLVGHAIIFQNAMKTFSEKSSREFVNKYFEDQSALLES